MKNMKRIAGILLGMIAVVGSAQAARTMNHGAMFHAYNVADVGNVDYVSRGARVVGSVSKLLIAGVARTPNSAGHQRVYVDGYHNSATTTTCTVYSYGASGTLYESEDISSGINRNGAWQGSVELSGNELTPWTTISVLCSVPGNSSSQMQAVTIEDLP